MESVEILKKLYEDLKDYQTPKAFYIGLTDYIKCINSDPSLKKVVADLSVLQQQSEGKRNQLWQLAFDAVDEMKRDLASYVELRSINDLRIQEIFQEYDEDVRYFPDASKELPDFLHDRLREVVETLYRLGGHEVFLDQYLMFKKDGEDNRVRHRLLKELEHFLKVDTDLKHERDTQLWGQVAEIYLIYDVIRLSRESRKELIQKYVSRWPRINWQIIKYRDFSREWDLIESGKDSTATNLRIEKLRPWLQRLQTHLVTYIPSLEVIGKAKEVTVTPQVRLEDGVLVWGKKSIPMERGQGQMFKLLHKNCRIYRDNRLIKDGRAIAIGKLKSAGGYPSYDSFRNGLKQMRGKFLRCEYPIKISNEISGHYIMEIHYGRTNWEN